MNKPTNPQLLDICIEAAKTAGTHALNNLDRREEVAEQFDHDVKLVMDRECQTIAEGVIHSYFPDHAILGEEGTTETTTDFEWVIDPIDGTANYTRGFPYWCCSVAVRRKNVVGRAALYPESLCPPHAPEYKKRIRQAVRRDNEVLAGCVFVPVLDECYSASIDTPALCNGEPIQISTIPNLGKATFFTGLTKDIDPHSLAFFNDMAPRVSKIRILGSAAIDICHVACGQSDGYYEAGIYIWDVAAARLIAERAGARITEWPRQEKYGRRFLCTVPALHEAVKQIAEKYFKL